MNRPNELPCCPLCFRPSLMTRRLSWWQWVCYMAGHSPVGTAILALTLFLLLLGCYSKLRVEVEQHRNHHPATQTPTF